MHITGTTVITVIAIFIVCPLDAMTAPFFKASMLVWAARVL